jgi:hypothetical protein
MGFVLFSSVSPFKMKTDIFRHIEAQHLSGHLPTFVCQLCGEVAKTRNGLRHGGTAKGDDHLKTVDNNKCYGSGMFITDTGSRIRLFSIPDPESVFFPSRIRIKEFKYFNPKMVSKL